MNGLGITCFAFLGLLVPFVRCQGMSGMGPMGMMLGMGGGEMMGGGGSMRDMMMMNALMGGMRGGGGGGGGGGRSTTPDLSMLWLLSQQGGMGGNMQDMLPMLAMMGSGSQRPAQTPTLPGGMALPGGMGLPGSMALPGGMPTPGAGTGTTGVTSMATGMAQMLGNSGSTITPAQQQNLWRVLQAAGQTQNIMEAVSSQSDRLYLEKNGISSVNPMMRVMMCPRQSSCQFVFCGGERPVMLYTPESFYVCQGCPTCPVESSVRRMQNMMQMFGARRAAATAGAPGVTAPAVTGPMSMPGAPMTGGPMSGFPMPGAPMTGGPMSGFPMPGAAPRGRMPPGMTAAMFELMQQQMAAQGSGTAPASMPPRRHMGGPPRPPPTGDFQIPPPRVPGPPPRSQGPPPHDGGRTMPAGGPPAGFIHAVENMGRRLQRRTIHPGPAPQQETAPP